MQRLKDIDMGGYSTAFHPGVCFSRFEHSLGVCFLLKLANASLEEQIHGLIHDVNHTVFSHAIDYALPSGSEADQNYQDENFSDFVRSSSINEILIKTLFLYNTHNHIFKSNCFFLHLSFNTIFFMSLAVG